MSMEALPFRLEDVLDNLAGVVGMKAEDKGLELLFSLPPDLPAGTGGRSAAPRPDAGQPGQQRGQVHRARRSRAAVWRGSREADATVRLHFWVRDTGIGMTPEQTGTDVPVVQPGRQLDHAQVRRHRAGPVDLQTAGRVDGRPHLGRQHARARVRPFTSRCQLRHAGDAGAAAHAARGEVRPASACWWRTTMPRRARSLSTMARSFGLEVDVASSGARGAGDGSQGQRDASCPTGVALMDWKMPGMDGIETVAPPAVDRRCVAPRPS